MAPSISAQSGVFAQGNSITITGTDFGTHGLDIETIEANVEAGTVGNDFSKSGWRNNFAWEDHQYNADQVHSADQSLRVIPTTTGGLFNGVLSHTLANPVLSGELLYVTWWQRPNKTNNGQWKMLRIENLQTVSDGDEQIVFFNWWDSGATQIVIDPGGANQQAWFPGNSTYPQREDIWSRQEVFLQAGTTGNTDGNLIWARYRGNEPTTSYATFDTGAIKTHVSAGDDYSYVFFQNGIFNGITELILYTEDYYIQKDTFARVEMSDSSTWTGRTLAEIQEPTVWSASSITFTANEGQLTSGDRYLYVLDSSENVNEDGFLIGSGSVADPSLQLIGLVG